MLSLYYLHGYQSSRQSNKFQNILKYYSNNPNICADCWEWNENMDLKKFLEEKNLLISRNINNNIILVADSMGGNLAMRMIDAFPTLPYLFTNPVFSASQLLNSIPVTETMNHRIFDFSDHKFLNLNGKLLISEFDEVLDSSFAERIFPKEKITKIPEKHSIVNFGDYMPLVDKLIRTLVQF